MFGQERLINVIVKVASKPTVIHRTLRNLQVCSVTRQIVDAEKELEITRLFLKPDSSEVKNAAFQLKRLKDKQKVLLYKPPLEVNST